ncbi:MAG: hypothetical protein ACYC5O_21595, partial [Anaerolineae bacterium]
MSVVGARPTKFLHPGPANGRYRPGARPPLVILVVLLVLLSACSYWEGPQAEPEYQRQVEAIVGDDQFDILRWEVGALAQEARDWVGLDVP